jgi:hypothetical protein
LRPFLSLTSPSPSLDKSSKQNVMLSGGDPEYVYATATCWCLRQRRNKTGVTGSLLQRLGVYGDVAILTGVADNTGTARGIPFSGKVRYTRVFVRRNNRWQAVLMQETSIPDQPSR